MIPRGIALNMSQYDTLRAMNKIILISLLLLASVPVALVVTIMTMPFWSWLEKTFMIESIGHSGPAAWCYLASYGLISSLLMAIHYLLSRRKSE